MENLGIEIIENNSANEQKDGDNLSLETNIKWDEWLCNTCTSIEQLNEVGCMVKDMHLKLISEWPEL